MLLSLGHRPPWFCPLEVFMDLQQLHQSSAVPLLPFQPFLCPGEGVLLGAAAGAAPFHWGKGQIGVCTELW